MIDELFSHKEAQVSPFPDVLLTNDIDPNSAPPDEAQGNLFKVNANRMSCIIAAMLRLRKSSFDGGRVNSLVGDNNKDQDDVQFWDQP